MFFATLPAASLTGIITSFVNGNVAEKVSKADQAKLYEAILTIQDDLEEHGDGAKLEPVRSQLATAVGADEKVRSAFPVELSAFVENDMEGPLKPVLDKLVAFERDVLTPALASVSTNEELLALEDLVDQCITLKPKVAKLDADKELKASHKALLRQWNAKSFQTHPTHTFLVAYESGNIPKIEKSASREKYAARIIKHIDELVGEIDHPTFSTAEKRDLFQALLTIQSDYEEYGDGARLEPLIQKYREAIGVRPLPQPPVETRPKEKAVEDDRPRVSSIRDMWQKKSASSSESISPVVSHRKQKVETTEEKRERYTTNIKETLGKMSFGSRDLGGSVDEVKRQIALIRKLPDSTPTELQHLERAVDLLIRPDEVTITPEESRLIELLGAKHKSGNIHDYQALEKDSVRDAQSAVLKELQREFPSLSRLELRAKDALRDIKEKTAQSRFELFKDKHPFKPSLNKNFAKHYPVLLNSFIFYSQKIAVDGLLHKWNEIKSVRDSATSGRFSRLIEDFYSHTDPSKQIPTYTGTLQQSFIDGLDLSRIDDMSSSELESYLFEEMTALIEVPGKWFEGFYTDFYGAEHDWLTANMDRIIRPYNQGDAPNTNLGSGVCYNNSLQVQRALLDSPVSSETILLGSNETTRYHQSRYKSQSEEVEKLRKEYAAAHKEERATMEMYNELLAAQEAYTQTEAKLPGVYGLRSHTNYTLSNPPAQTSLQDHLVNTFEQWSNKGHKQIVLVLRSSTAGHAVNVQFDKARGVYRLRDDNKGIIDFGDMSTMKKELSTYFKAFYSDYNKFIFESYDKA